MDQLIADASDRMDELLKAPEPSSKVSTLDLEQSAPQEEPPTARFGKPQSRRPALKREKSNPAVTPSRRAPPPITARSKGPGEARMRQIYDSYVEAKRNNNERTDKIDYESVAKSLKKMVPKLDRKHKGKRVDFKVVVKDGKASGIGLSKTGWSEVTEGRFLPGNKVAAMTGATISSKAAVDAVYDAVKNIHKTMAARSAGSEN